MKKQWLQLAAVVAVLAVGIGGAVVLVKTRKAPGKQTQPVAAPLVRVAAVKKSNVAVRVEGHGEVRPKVTAQIVPQVAGRVLAVHASLHAGGMVKAGEELVKIDPVDFELAVSRAESGVATAHAAIRTAEAHIAEKTATAKDMKKDLEKTRTVFARGGANERDVDKALVGSDTAQAAVQTAEAEKTSAEAQLSSAKADLDQAKISLGRTGVTLPFDAVIVEESVDLGQFLVAGQSIGSAYGTDAVEVAVPVEDKELGWLNVMPLSAVNGSSAAEGPKAELESNFAGRSCIWTGRVVRAEGQVDRRSRMVKLVVEVAKPFEVDDKRPPLVPGSFVKVSIEGRELTDVFELPRVALRGGDSVWTVRDGKLHIQKVQVARVDRSNAYISDGLYEGDSVVVSPLEVATEGMAVKIEEEAVGG